MFSISNYRVAYGQSEIIPGMNFQVQENEIVTMLGRNGMGKTTLMKSIMGMSGEAAGSITLKGREIAGMKSYDRVRSGLAFVPQGRMIFSTMTVQENIETGLTSTRRKRVSSDIFELFPVLKDMKSRRGGNLSGGQQQQLAIARALASDPRVLLLDEPTEGIQPSIIKEIARALKRIRDQRGLSIIASEQVLSFALDIADRILVIEKGVIVQNESAADVNPDRVAAYLSV